MQNQSRIREDKLIILYTLRTVKKGLTRLSLSEIILETVQFNYIDLMMYIDRMIKDGLISTSENHDDQQVLSLTITGKETIDALKDTIPAYIQELIDLYIKTNNDRLNNDVRIEGNVIEKGPGDFQAIMSISENGINLMGLSINAPTKESGLDLCRKWKADPQKYYAAIIHCFDS